jgi:hypothetical protein
MLPGLVKGAAALSAPAENILHIFKIQSENLENNYTILI